MLKQMLEDNSKKYRNTKQVYRYIHKYGPITKARLIEQTGLKQTTMVRILDALLADRIIEINGYDESSGGRPPALYQINSSYNYIVGIDLSRTHTKIKIVDLRFDTIDDFAFTMTKKHTPPYTIQLIKEKITEILVANQITEDQLLGIGIGSVGPLDRERGVILEPELFPAPGWNQIAIVEELEEAFAQKIILENGANVAAIGEYYHATSPQENILYCISGIGLRCGILTNGQFIQNKTGDASSFGHMILDISSDLNSNSRTLSSYISFDSILEETKRRIKNGEYSLLIELADQKLNNCTLEHLFLALRDGDPLVKEVVLNSAYYYGVGLANMVNVLHPDQVILSSFFIYDFPEYYQTIVNTAKKFIYRYDKNDISFGKGELKDNAVSIGASVLVFDSYFRQ